MHIEQQIIHVYAMIILAATFSMYTRYFLLAQTMEIQKLSQETKIPM